MTCAAVCWSSFTASTSRTLTGTLRLRVQLAPLTSTQVAAFGTVSTMLHILCLASVSPRQWQLCCAARMTASAERTMPLGWKQRSCSRFRLQYRVSSSVPLPRRCLDALVTMGVLIPGNDMTAVRRTAAFFLTNFRERLAQQRAEAAANPQYGDSFKGELSKEEKQAKRKQILSSIGALPSRWYGCAVVLHQSRALAAHRCVPSVTEAPEQWFVTLLQERICCWHRLIRCARSIAASALDSPVVFTYTAAYAPARPDICHVCSRSLSGSQRHSHSW